jgi:hypothetical protein
VNQDAYADTYLLGDRMHMPAEPTSIPSKRDMLGMNPHGGCIHDNLRICYMVVTDEGLLHSGRMTGGTGDGVTPPGELPSFPRWSSNGTDWAHYGGPLLPMLNPHYQPD